MNTDGQVTTTDKAIGQPNGLICQLEGCGKALVGQGQKRYCSRKHGTLARRAGVSTSPNGLVCQLEGCGKALVGQQRKYCSTQHTILAYYARVSAQPNGLLCQVCGKALKGLQQKKYCSPECTQVMTGRILTALSRTEHGRQQRRVGVIRRRARIPTMSIVHRQRYRGLILPDGDAARREEIIAQERAIHMRQGRITRLVFREKRGDFPCCPRCGSEKTRRAGTTMRPKGQCLAEGCGQSWTIGKDYAPLICPRCASDNTKKGGYNREGTPLGYCMDCKRRNDGPHYWTIGHDYGPPLTPAMVNLLRTARQTTLTPDEEAQMAEILGSAHEAVTP
jgi:hypothetical protein